MYYTLNHFCQSPERLTTADLTGARHVLVQVKISCNFREKTAKITGLRSTFVVGTAV